MIPVGIANPAATTAAGNSGLMDGVPILPELELVEAVVLMTDVEDSTGLAHTLGTRRFARWMQHHLTLCERSIVRSGGAVLGMSGDGVVAVWEAGDGGLPDAVGAAVMTARDLMRSLDGICRRQRAAGQATRRTRIGIHCGEIAVVRRPGGTDIFGPVVNDARRMEEAGRARRTSDHGAVLTISRSVAARLSPLVTGMPDVHVFPGPAAGTGPRPQESGRSRM